MAYAPVVNVMRATASGCGNPNPTRMTPRTRQGRGALGAVPRAPPNPGEAIGRLSQGKLACTSESVEEGAARLSVFRKSLTLGPVHEDFVQSPQPGLPSLLKGLWLRGRTVPGPIDRTGTDLRQGALSGPDLSNYTSRQASSNELPGTAPFLEALETFN